MAVAVAVVACGPQAAETRPVRVEERLPVDGARLYLMTRGEDACAPLLVWLHGGPGGAERPLFRLYNASLEHRFVVTYWDQRGAGRSYDPDADPKALTIARHVADLDAVVDHLRGVYHRDRVILVGHSWGATLGMLYTHAYPGKVAAVVGVGQPVNERARQASQYEFVAGEARRRGDVEAQRRLAEIGPPPYSAEREIATQRLVERFGGYYRQPPDFKMVLLRGVLGGHVRPWELRRYFKANDVSLQAMNDEMLGLDLARSVPAVKAPVVFVLGRYDRQVDSRQAAAYFQALEAPRKDLVWFENSAHNIPFEEPERFNAELPRALARVGALPEALAGEGGKNGGCDRD